VNQSQRKTQKQKKQNQEINWARIATGIGAVYSFLYALLFFFGGMVHVTGRIERREAHRKTLA
jgi:high-affinity Fe2+/Pb2+ permease